MAVALSSGCQKLGQPVWLSNLVVEENSCSWQPAQANVPVRCSSFSDFEAADWRVLRCQGLAIGKLG
jgi:hypothetical protein